LKQFILFIQQQQHHQQPITTARIWNELKHYLIYYQNFQNDYPGYDVPLTVLAYVMQKINFANDAVNNKSSPQLQISSLSQQQPQRQSLKRSYSLEEEYNERFNVLSCEDDICFDD